MLHSGITELMSYLWNYETLSYEGKHKGMEITGKDGGLQVRMGIDEDPDSTAKSMYQLNLSSNIWQGLLRYLQTKKGYGNKQAQNFLIGCIRASLPRRKRRSFGCFIGILSLMMVLVLTAALISLSNDGVATLDVAAMTLLAALWLVVIFSKGQRCAQAASRLRNADTSEVPVILDKALPYASRSVFASVNRVLGLTLLAGCVGCFTLGLLPEESLMLPTQRMENYYSAGDLLLEMEDAEKALSRMPSKKVMALLQEKIDSLPEGELDAFLSGTLAARLKQRGKFTQAEAEALVDRTLTRHPVSGIEPQYESQTRYLTELVAAASEELRHSYPFRISELPALDSRTLTAVGKGMAGMELDVLVEGYYELMEKGQDGISFLHGAIGAVSSIAEAEELLTAAEEEHRTALCGAYAAGFTDPDDVLAYLRMAAGLGIPLAQCAPKGISIQMDLGRFPVSGEPINHLPDEPYTILPLLRMEDSGVCGYDETNAEYQDVCLWAEALAVLPADRIPQTTAEADLILLMDHQYVSDGSYSLRYRNWLGEHEDKFLAKFSSVQRLSVYDAITGECLLVVDELSQQPEELPRSLANETFYEDILNPGHAFDEVEPYRYGAPDMNWEKELRREFCKTLQSSSGDLSLFLPTTK